MITIEVNSNDITDLVVFPSLSVKQNLTNQADTASFTVRKFGSRTFVPQFNDDIGIFDGSTKIFGGTVLQVVETVESGGGGVVFAVTCADYTYEMDKQLASRVYENETIADIISDLVTSYAPGFTSNNVASDFVIEKIVFNQVPISQCLKRLADIIRYDWYVDETKDIHFFAKETKAAPFDLTDTNGNYIYKSLTRTLDGSQVVNRVKVRGGEYNGASYTDTITVSGNASKSFKLPYRFANLQIELDTGSGFAAQDVGVDFIDDFTSKDVLYNFQEQMIRFDIALSAGNKIRFTGNPKIRVLGVAEDPDSIALYGKIEKLIRDDSIQSNTIARRRAQAELYAYSQTQIDARFNTYTAGLRAGMLITVQSDLRGNTDSLIIKAISFKPRTPNEYVYSVECISTKRFDLIDLLQKILEPNPLSTDEVETAEEAFTDTQEITITDEYEMVAAFDDQQAITLTENYILNPLGAGVNAEYVLAPYTPTSQTDTKRAGRLNISLVVY
jgi:hypothetical protein